MLDPRQGIDVIDVDVSRRRIYRWTSHDGSLDELCARVVFSTLISAFPGRTRPSRDLPGNHQRLTHRRMSARSAKWTLTASTADARPVRRRSRHGTMAAMNHGRSSTHLGYLDLGLLLCLGAVWGAAFLFLRVASPEVGPVWTAEIRIALAGTALVLVVGPRRLWALRHRLRQLGVIGITFSALPSSLLASRR
jgi:hypothetical protein